MTIEAIALTYEAALRQAEIPEGALLFDSKIPAKANSDIWIKRLERMYQNKGMTNRLKGIHGEIKKRHGKALLRDLNRALSGVLVIELSGAELKRHRESNNIKWTRYKVFRFVTFNDI